jgi:hypothetical protein
MTSKDNANDQELLERYRRASDTQAAAPSDTVRAAILAEGRRVAERRATEMPRQAIDVTRPAANDSRWKITAFGTAGAALVAVLLFAPRMWESGPAAPATVSGAPSAPGPQEQVSDTKAIAPTAESLVPQAPPSGKSLPRATVVQPRQEVQMLPEGRQTDASAQSAAPAENPDSTNLAPAPPRAAAGEAARAAPRAARATSLSAERAAHAEIVPAPAALLSAAASGDTMQTTALLDQGAALDVRDELGRTPLMRAILQGRLEVVRVLLARGADPNVADNAGRTPLQQAKRENLGEIAGLLARAGAY